MVLSEMQSNEFIDRQVSKRPLHVPASSPNKKAKTSISLRNMLSEKGDDIYFSFDPPLLAELDDESSWIGGEIDYSVGFVLSDSLGRDLSDHGIEDIIKHKLVGVEQVSEDSIRRAVYDFICGSTDDLDQVADAVDLFDEKGGYDRELVGDVDLCWWNLDTARPAYCRRLAFFRRLSRPLCIKAHHGETVVIHRSRISLLKLLLDLEPIQEYVIDAILIHICCLDSLEAITAKEKKFMESLIRSVSKLLKSDASRDKRAYRDISFFVCKLRPALADMLPTLVFEVGSDTATNNEGTSTSYKQKARIWQQYVDQVQSNALKPKMSTKKTFDTKSCPVELEQERREFKAQRHILLEEHETRKRSWSNRKVVPVGSSPSGTVVYTDAEISLKNFIKKAKFLNNVNASFPRQTIPGFSRPRCQALDISQDKVDALHQLLFDADGSLSNAIRQDIDSSSKHGYINFANLNCAKERRDRRWQVPIRKHSLGSLIPTREKAEQILGGIYHPQEEAMYDLGILIGGTEDQSLHHDVARQSVSWIPEKLLWDEDAIPVTGWEIDRLAYNEAMASPNAPSSILIGMGDKSEVLLGVQKDQIVRNSDNTCQVRGGVEGQTFEIVRENDHLAVVRAKPGAMFTGDFPHAGVRNVVLGSEEDRLLQKLNRRIAFVLESFSENDRLGQTKAIIEVLCKFPNLDKLCRLHCSTEITTGKLNIPANTIGFSGCLANPPDPRCFESDVVAEEPVVVSDTAMMDDSEKTMPESDDEESDYECEEDEEWKDDDANDSVPSLWSPARRMSD